MRYFTHAVVFVALGLLATGCGSRATRFDTISVHGPERFRQEVTNSLALLKAKSPSAYATITNDVAIIRTGAHRRMFAAAQPPRLELPLSASADTTTWRAGVIAHDVYHSH